MDKRAILKRISRGVFMGKQTAQAKKVNRDTLKKR